MFQSFKALWELVGVCQPFCSYSGYRSRQEEHHFSQSIFSVISRSFIAGVNISHFNGEKQFHYNINLIEEGLITT
jgi:hypothetical protein